MSVKRQQLSNMATDQDASVKPDVLRRRRGFAGNHTQMRKKEPRYHPAIEIEKSVDSRLPFNTPAWTEHGRIHLSATSLLLPAAQRSQILRHELVHSEHQGLGPTDESASARRRAEALAEHGAGHHAELKLIDLSSPVPSLLAYPPRNYSPWTTVWIGHPGLVCEIVEAGVRVRIFRTYEDLNIHLPGYQTYECGNHASAAFAELAKKIKRIAQKTAIMNKKIPTTAKEQRVTRVMICQKSSGFRVFDGEGLIVLEEKDFQSDKYEDTVVHEGAHAIFEFHSVSKGAASARIPDNLALQISDLYSKLSNTKLVPLPTAGFAGKAPPSLTLSESAASQPAGLVMVSDTLWSGSGGHPWQGVDEFFASAYSAFVQQPKRLGQIIDFYRKFDPAIGPLAVQLLAILQTVGTPKAHDKLRAPRDSAKAKEQLGSIGKPPDYSKDPGLLAAGGLDWLLDPSKMPSADNIACPSVGSRREFTEDELLDFDKSEKKKQAK